MTPAELAADLRTRINPKYANQLGCESYLNMVCAEAIEGLIAELEKVTREAHENKDKARWANAELERVTTLARGQHVELYNARLELERLKSQEPVAWALPEITQQHNGQTVKHTPYHGYPVALFLAAGAQTNQLLENPDELKAGAQPVHPTVPQGWKLLKDSTLDERSWPEDYKYENGNYQNSCFECGRMFNGYKRRVMCKVCSEAPVQAVVKDSLTTQEPDDLTIAHMSGYYDGKKAQECKVLMNADDAALWLPKNKQAQFDVLAAKEQP